MKCGRSRDDVARSETRGLGGAADVTSRMAAHRDVLRESVTRPEQAVRRRSFSMISFATLGDRARYGEADSDVAALVARAPRPALAMWRR